MHMLCVDLVMLGPDEQFTLLSLSGGKPKQPNAIKSLCLLLGPDFCTDIITVETADHARLQMKLSYNWYFDVASREDAKEAAKIFSVPDFVGLFINLHTSYFSPSWFSLPFHILSFSAFHIIHSCFGNIWNHPTYLFQFGQNIALIEYIWDYVKKFSKITSFTAKTRETKSRNFLISKFLI